MSAIYQSYLTRVYRQDIQGIRAIGAIMIMVYHLWMNKVSGGVDVFFVVSGFFMASVLLAQLGTEGKIQPFLFWGKIIKRVAPSAYVVLIATLLLSFLFIPETQWMNLVDEVMASAFHVENIYLMRSSVDYLARQEPPSAVQQFWALSIQMQFYFLLPLIFIFGSRISAISKSVSPLVLTILAIMALSFAYSIHSTLQSPDSAYFNPLARIWEFFVGVLIAVASPYFKLGRRTRSTIGFIGLLALLIGGLLIPKTINFPGYIALVPVGAAACLIISGSRLEQTSVSRFLSHRYFAFLGGISFTIYLWHWPLMVFYLQSTGAQTVSIPAGLLIITLSILLAFLTNVFVERRFIAMRDKRQNPLVPYLIGVLFFIPAAALAGALKLHFESIAEDQHSARNSFFEGAKIEAQLDATSVPYKQFLAAKTDKPDSYRDDCHQKTASPEVIACEYGDVNASAAIALVGGSHATQWLPALDIIGQRLNFKVLNITKSYCPLGALTNSHASCVEWNRRVIEYLADMKPLLVITNSTRAAKGDQEEHVPSSYVKQWQALSAAGIPVIGIRDNPQFSFDVVHCIVRNKENPLACSIPRSQVLLSEDPAAALIGHVENLKLVDMSSYFCTSDTCTTVFDDILMYRDKEHISVSYVTYLTNRLHKQLVNASPHIFGPRHVTQEGHEHSE